jgi:hypothetical protein
VLGVSTSVLLFSWQLVKNTHNKTSINAAALDTLM